MRNIVIVATCIGVVQLCLVPGSQALWGKTKTATEDGDADMGLPEYKGLKHAIGCKDFENKSGWHGEWELGYNLSIMLESALYDSGRFVIVEREKLGHVLLEQDLAAGGRMAQAEDIAKTGMLRPAKYLGTGAITEVDVSQSSGDGGFRIKNFNIGLAQKAAHLTIIAKLVDTTTGEVVAKKRIVGKPTATRLRFSYSGSDLGVDLSGFKKTPLGQAAQDAINQAAKFFAKTMEEFPFAGSVIKTASSGQVIGKLKLAKVKEKISYCDVIEGETQPVKGTIVQP